MKIIDVKANNLTIPYPGEVRPAWQPGLVATSHNFTLVRILTDEGVTGYGGTSGHFAGTILTQVKPYLIGKDPFATERSCPGLPARWERHLVHRYGPLGHHRKAANLPLYRLWGYSWTRSRLMRVRSRWGPRRTVQNWPSTISPLDSRP